MMASMGKQGHAGLLAILATQCRRLWQQAQSGEIKRALNPGSSHYVTSWWLRCGSRQQVQENKGLGVLKQVGSGQATHIQACSNLQDAQTGRAP